MKRLWVVFLLFAPIVLAGAVQDATQELIELDKSWGQSARKADHAAVGRIVADDVIAVTPVGMTTKTEMLAALEPTEDPTYISDDYKVMMLGPETAVMAHRAEADGQPYRSLHVWVKRDGRWQCVATATVPQTEQ